MKIIYVASPYAGDVKKNTEFAKQACRYVLEQGHAFFAPHLLYPQLLYDESPWERQAGLDMGVAILSRCDELYVCGDQISPGMAQEIDQANTLGIPIRYLSTEQILSGQKSTYAIWAKATPVSSLSGQSGFLCENRKRLSFPSWQEAASRLQDIQGLCSSAAEFKLVTYPGEYASDRNMHLETLKNLILETDSGQDGRTEVEEAPGQRGLDVPGMTGLR
jgi:hypothetical protein